MENKTNERLPINEPHTNTHTWKSQVQALPWPITSLQNLSKFDFSIQYRHIISKEYQAIIRLAFRDHASNSQQLFTGEVQNEDSHGVQVVDQTEATRSSQFPTLPRKIREKD